MGRHLLQLSWKRLFLFPAAIGVFGALTVVGMYVLPARVDYHITERYRFTNPGLATRVNLAVMLPRSNAYQRVEGLDIQWRGDYTNNVERNVQAVLFVGEAASDQPVEAVLAYNVFLPQGPISWKEIPLDTQYQPQDEIESDSPAIVQAARQVSQGSIRADAYAIYRFTAGALSWPTGSRIGAGASALEAYQTRVGGCAEFANLMVALSRASGIPAQTVSGLVLPEAPPYTSRTATGLHPGAAHAWVEFYTEQGWTLADPSWASRSVPWIWFGRNDGLHLSYGEAGAEKLVYEAMEEWARNQGALIAAMSAPLKFTASAGYPAVTVTPAVTVRKGWDGRWVNASVLVGLGILVWLGVEWIWKRYRERKSWETRG